VNLHTVKQPYLQKGLQTRPVLYLSLILLTLFYTHGLGTVVLHVMVPQPHGFSFAFLNMNSLLNGEGNGAIQSGGELPVTGGRGNSVGITFHAVLAL
jgi:hypothetical protein